MRYQEYKEKLIKRKRRRKLLLKLSPLIFLGILLISGGILALCYFSGTLMGEPEITVKVGEEPVVKAGTFLNTDYRVEYKNGEEWTETAPSKPGNYVLRIITKSVFGEKTYEYSYEVEKEPLKLSLETKEITYGDDPVFKTDKENVEIVSAEYEYESLCLADTKVKVNTETVKLKNSEGVDVTDWYQIESDYEEIHFHACPVEIHIPDITRVYDGTSKFDFDYEVLTKLPYMADFKLEFGLAPTLVGIYTVEVKDVKAFNQNGEEIQNYRVSVNNPEVTITKADITVKTNNDTKEFDGLPLLGTYTLEGDFYDKATISSQSSLTYVGEEENKMELSLTRDGMDIAFCYEITYDYGTLTVTKKNLKVKAKSVNVTYDGLPHSLSEIEGNEDYVFTVSSSSYTNAGTYTLNDYTVTVADKDGNDLSDCFTIEAEESAITILKRKLIIVPWSLTKEYDGNAVRLTEDEFEFTPDSDSLVEGDEITSVTFTGDFGVSALGSYNIAISGITINGKALEDSNYEASFPERSFEIKKRTITILKQTIEKTFDGNAADVTTLKYSGTLLSGDSISYQLEKDYIACGTYSLKNIIVSLKDSENHACDYYEVKMEEDITLSILKIKISVVFPEKKAVYTGNAIGYAISDLKISGNLLAGDTLVYDNSTSVTDVGRYRILVDGSVSVNYGFREGYSDYYDILYAGNAYLTILARPVTFETESRKEEYARGETLASTDAPELIEGSLAEGDTIKYLYTASLNKIGKTDNTVEITILDSDGVDVTKNYNITIEEGVLEYVFRLDED